MALFTVQVFKHLGATKWTNVYHLDAVDLASAVAATDHIKALEQAIHYNVVNIDYARVSTFAEGDNVFETVPINATGGRDLAGVDYLPLFNTMRVDISVDGGGRPSRKYYRIPIPESFNSNGNLDSAQVSFLEGAVQTAITDLAADATPLVDPDGQEWNIATGFHQVQMRQLHRKRRRSSP
jgi:hypothetical protein